MFENFWGQAPVVSALTTMAGQGRIPQSILFAGPEGVGKATLARRFAAALLGDAAKIEQDDLSRAENLELIAEREKLSGDKRNDNPLLFGSHPDFLTFPPDGPLRQLTIEQMRLLKERAAFTPLRGTRRVFLIDQVDRANEQAANSLLKILEEPPPHLVVILTASNAYDLLPTIRSRTVPFQLTPLSDDEMKSFVKSRGLDRPDRRVALAAGSPGAAVSIDLDLYDKRRSAMLALLEAASGAQPFGVWIKHSEAIGRSKNEKLDLYLRILTVLLRDVMVIAQARDSVRNADIRSALEAISRRVDFAWIRRAVAKTDELNELLRRNIQKQIALDALIVELRG